MAQVGGVLVLSTFENPENYLTFFGRIENAKFKRPVLPGDVLVFKLELISPIRRGISHMMAKAYVNDELVTEAEMKAKNLKNMNQPYHTYILVLKLHRPLLLNHTQQLVIMLLLEREHGSDLMLQ